MASYESPMDVEESTDQLNIEVLDSFGIYDDEFPLPVRVYMDFIIKEYKLNESCLDFNSVDDNILAEVESICQSAYEKLKHRLAEVPRSSSEYLTVSKVEMFIQRYEDYPRSLFELLTQRLEQEKHYSSQLHMDTFGNLRRNVIEVHKTLMNQITSIIKSRKDQLEHMKYLNDYYRTLLHNKEIVTRKGQPQSDDVAERLLLQKEQFKNSVMKFHNTLSEDAMRLRNEIAKVPTLIDDFISICHITFTEIRIHHRRLFDSFLSLLRKTFSETKDGLGELDRIINVYLEKFAGESELFTKDRVTINKSDLEPIKVSECLLIRNALVVAEEPPFSMRCLKKDKKLNSYELLLLFNKPNVSSSTVLEANLLTEMGLRRVKEELRRGGRIPKLVANDLGGKFKGNQSTLEHDVKRDIVKLSFKDLTIIEANRKHKTNEAVTQQKHAILFSGNLEVDNKKVEVCCFSLPVIICVHGNQASKSLAAIFWDDNFPVGDRSGLEIRSSVSWTEMSVAIKNMFLRELGREPTAANLDYLKERLFGEATLIETGITFDMFAKNTIKNIKLSFWEWLWGTIQLLDGDEKLKQLWTNGYIVGYISQQSAKKLLNDLRDQALPLSDPSSERLFLIRFSESQKELITIQGHLHDQNGKWGIFSVNPYKAADLKSIPLSTRILDRTDCETLLYDTDDGWIKRNKRNIFSVDTVDDDQSALPYGYISWTLKERTDTQGPDLSQFRLQDEFGINSPTSVADSLYDSPANDYPPRDLSPEYLDQLLSEIYP